jgi:hypothetical protein
MKRMSVSVVLAAVISLTALSLIAAQPDQRESPSGFLSSLHNGQAIALKDLGTSFEITVFPNGPDPLGFEVMEVGRDFVAVWDVTGIRVIRIPVYSIKSITVLKVGRK